MRIREKDERTNCRQLSHNVGELREISAQDCRRSLSKAEGSRGSPSANWLALDSSIPAASAARLTCTAYKAADPSIDRQRRTFTVKNPERRIVCGRQRDTCVVSRSVDDGSLDKGSRRLLDDSTCLDSAMIVDGLLLSAQFLHVRQATQSRLPSSSHPSRRESRSKRDASSPQGRTRRRA